MYAYVCMYVYLYIIHALNIYFGLSQGLYRKVEICYTDTGLYLTKVISQDSDDVDYLI